jgi:hypothetical protein
MRNIVGHSLTVTALAVVEGKNKQIELFPFDVLTLATKK